MAVQDDRANSSLGDGLGVLNRIPEEMRLKVFESLVPDHLPIGTSSELSPDIQDSRKALLNLCFTSKKCYALALPFLYKYVIITDHVQMARLLVTLISNKERQHGLTYWDFVGKTIDSLENSSRRGLEREELDTVKALEEFLPELRRVIERAPEALEDSSEEESEEDFSYEGDYRWHFYEVDLNHVHYGLLQLLLQMQINIKDILISVWPGESCRDLCPWDTHDRIMSQFQLDPTRPPLENPLKNLLSIRKQSEPNRADRERFIPDPLAPEYLACKDWEFLRDDGHWFFNHHLNRQGWPKPWPPPTDLAIFSHVTDLGLYHSWTHPAQLRVILSSCNSLKVLCYTTNATNWSDKYRPILTDEYEGTPVPPLQQAVSTLQQALEEVMGTLKELRLGWSRPGHVLTADEEEAVAPHRVDISGFPHLTPGKVDIDPCFDARPLSD